MKRTICLMLLALPLAGQPSRSGLPETPGAANLPAQKIGARDLVAISVYNAPELSRPVRVAEEGWIQLPMLKRRIEALGLLPGELENRIADARKGFFDHGAQRPGGIFCAR